VNPWQLASNSEAFNLGRSEAFASGNHAWRIAMDARDASLAWHRARFEHSETSYFGRVYIDRMRAFQLGMRSGARERMEAERIGIWIV
jgi:hypothetical protein